MLHGVPKNEPRRAQDDPKRGQKRPKTTLRGAQEAQKSDPESQDEKRTDPRRSQDRLGPPTSRCAQFSGVPGAPFGRPKRHQNDRPNDQKSKRKFKTKKRRPKAILDPSWSDLGSILAPCWGQFGPKTSGKHNVSLKVTFSKISRFEDGSETNLGRTRRQHDRK